MPAWAREFQDFSMSRNHFNFYYQYFQYSKMFFTLACAVQEPYFALFV